MRGSSGCCARVCTTHYIRVICCVKSFFLFTLCSSLLRYDEEVTDRTRWFKKSVCFTAFFEIKIALNNEMTKKKKTTQLYPYYKIYNSINLRNLRQSFHHDFIIVYNFIHATAWNSFAYKKVYAYVLSTIPTKSKRVRNYTCVI